MWGAIMAIAVTGLLMATACLMRDKVKALIIAEINAQVTEPINVNGNIDFSLIKNFPFASVSFDSISIKNKLNKGPEYFIRADNFSVLFNMWGLMNNKIQISRIHLSDGELNIYIDAKGNADYEIFKPSGSSSSSSTALNLNIKKAVVKNLKLTYQSEGKEEDVKVLIEKYTLGGNFQSDRFDMATSGAMMIDLVRLNGTDYLLKKHFDADITIDVDQKEETFRLNKADIEVDKNKFNVAGYFIGNKKNTYVNFTANSKGKDISKLIALIPARYKSVLAGTEGAGGYEVKAKVIGNIRANINPDIEINAALTNAQIKIPKLRMPLAHVTANGFYHMDSVGMDNLWIRQFHSEFDGYPQQFSLKLVNLSNPDFVFDADGTADLHALRALFADSTVSADGQIAFRQFHIEGSKTDIDQSLAANIKASGDFSLKNVDIKSGGIEYSHMNGSLSYADQNVTIKGFTLNLLNGSYAFDGRISNIITFVLSQNRRVNTNDIPLGLHGSLHVKNLDLGKIISAYSKSNKEQADNGKTALDAHDVFNMKGHLNIAIDNFTYNKIALANVVADLGISPYRLDINSLTAATMGGTVSDTSYIAFNNNQQMIMTLGLQISKIDLPRLFQECGNFNQATLTDKNLKGTIYATVNLRTVWNNYTTIDLNQLEGAVDCRVSHGELNNFAPLRSASAFIKIQELNHIVFSDLTNQLYIKKRVITIPRMEVQSSALNLMMAGTHSLDNQIDYHLKINLRKLLAAKFGRKENDEAYIEEDPYEGVNLFLQITGDISNPKVKMDKKSVKQKLKQDLAAQKEELKDLFKKDKKKKINEDEAKREDKYYDTRTKPAFIDFQEDSTK
jgi:hypothetical protein